MAGKRQGNVLAAILNNFELAEEASEIAANSAGSAWQENEVYLDSINGKIGQFQASFQGLSTSILDSDVAKWFIDLGTAITQAMQSLTEFSGGPGWLIGGALGAFASFRDAGLFQVIDDPNTFSGKKFKNIFDNSISDNEIKQIEKYNELLGKIGKGSKDAEEAMKKLQFANENTRFGDYIKQLGDSEASIDGFIASINKTTVASKLAAGGMKLLAGAANTLIGAFAAMAINAVVNGLVEIATSTEKIAEAGRATATTYQEQTTSLEDYRSRVEELNEQLASGDLGYEESKHARIELLDIQSQMISQFGIEASSAGLVTDAINGQADAWERLGKQQYDAYIREIDATNNWSRFNPFGNQRNGVPFAGTSALNDARVFMENEHEITFPTFDLNDFSDIENYIDKNYELLDLYTQVQEAVSKEFPDAISENSVGGLELSLLPEELDDVNGKLQSVYGTISEVAHSIGEASGFSEQEISAVINSMQSGLDSQVATLTDKTAEYQSTYDQYLQGYIKYYSEFAEEYKNVEEAYQRYSDALATNDEAEIDTARASLESVWDDAVSAINASSMDDAIKANFIDAFEGIAPDLPSLIDEWDFADLLKSSLSDTLKSLDGIDENELLDALLDGGESTIKSAYDRIASLATELQIIPEGSEYELESIQALIDILVELGYVSEGTRQSADEISAAFTEIAESFEKVQGEVSAVNEILSSQDFGSSMSLDSYEQLIAANEDYANALEYTSQGIQLNADAAKELLNEDIAKQTLSAKVALQQQAEQYKENASAIETLERRLRLINDLESQGTSINSQYTNLLQQQLNSYYAEQDAIQGNIDKYNILISSLQQATSAYQLWQDAQQTPNQGDTYFGLNAAIEDINDGLNTHRTGTDDYQAAAGLLVPQEVLDQGLSAVGDYVDDVLSQFIRLDSESGEVTYDGISNFAKQIENLGYVTEDSEGNQTLKVTSEMMDEIADKLNITTDLAEILFTVLDEFEGFELEWNVDDLGATEEEVQAYIDDLNSSIDELHPFEFEANSDSIQKAKAQIYELTHPDYDTAGISESILANLQIEEEKVGASPEDLALLNQMQITIGLPTDEEIEEAMDKLNLKVEMPSTAELDALGQAMTEEYEVGNVDLTMRPVIENEDGTISTVLSQWFDANIGEEETPVAVHLTPILQDGTKLSEEELEDYYISIIDGAQTEADILAADDPANGGKGIVLRVKTNFDFEEEEEWDEGLHEVQDEYYNMKEEIESLNLDPLSEAILTLYYRINLESEGSSEETEVQAELYELAHSEVQDVDIPVNVKAHLNITEEEGDLRSQIEEKKAELAEETDVNVKAQIQADIDTLREQLKDTLLVKAKIAPLTQEDVDSAVSSIEDQMVEIQAKIDATTDPAEIDALLEQLSALIGLRADIQIMADKSDFDAKASEVQAKGDEIDQDSATFTIYGDNSDAMSALREVQNYQLSNKTQYIDIIRRYSTKNESGSSGSNGTGELNGTAHANGSWGTEKRERALVGEIGREIVVDPNTGKWHTVGDFGPEFVDLPKGAIVFNHEQTEEILRRGYVAGSGASYLQGNAYSRGVHGNWGGWENIGRPVDGEYREPTSVDDSLLTGNINGNNDLAQSYDNVASSASKASEEVEEYISDLWELYEVETKLADIQADSDILETQLDMADSANKAIGIQEKLLDQYEAEQEALHNLVEARRELIQEDIATLRDQGFIINYDPEQNNLFIENTEHVNDLMGATQEETNDLRKEMEELINSIIDMNDANQESGKSWWDLAQNIQQVKEELAENATSIFDDFIDYMDAFELWADSGINRVAALSQKQAELNRLYEEGYLTIQAYREQSFDLQQEIYEEQRDSITEIIELTEEMIKQEVEDQIDALEKQIEAYRELIDLRKEALEENKRENDHQDEINEKLEEMAKLRQQIDRLNLAAQSGDRAAAAEKAALDEQYAELQKELIDMQADYSYDTQQDALDKEMEAFEEQKNEEIKKLEESIDTEVKLYNLAIARINQGWDALYDDLMKYNSEYGDAIDGEDSLKTAWENATEAVKDYAYNVEAALQGIKTEGSFGNIQTNRVNELINQMKANGQGWANATTQAEKDRYEAANEALAKQLSVELGRPVVKGYDGEWYLDKVGGQKLYDVYPGGTTSRPSTEDDANKENATEAKVRELVRNMRANGSKYANATSDAEREVYAAANRQIAQQVSSLIGQPVVIGDDGVWYIGAVGRRKLYDVYHKGGIVGNAGTLKDNEMFTVLEKGEFVLSDSQKKTLFDLIGVAKNLNDIPTNKLVASRGIETRDFGGDSFQADFDIDFNVSGELDTNSARKFADMFADYAISKMQKGFSKSGIFNGRAAFGKA